MSDPSLPLGAIRGRRLRRTAALRSMVRETHLAVSDLIYPLFVSETAQSPIEVASMPGVYQLPVGAAVEECRRAHDLGIEMVLLFGLPAAKDDTGSGAWSEDGAVQRATSAIKGAVPELLVATDVCLCEYTSHGHCGVLADGVVDNDATVPLLARTALSHAQAGADIVAPSDMMDLRIGAIRRALDRASFTHTAILAYSAKYASAFYGPFRDAAASAPAFGDRRGYQMDPANVREALREVRLDVEEGADMIMVKPALAYLDVVRAVRESVDLPLVAYNVSGEYAMLKAAARAGWVDESAAAMEILTGIKRAGADAIITYHALDIARALSAVR